MLTTCYNAQSGVLESKFAMGRGGGGNECSCTSSRDMSHAFGNSSSDCMACLSCAEFADCQHTGHMASYLVNHGKRTSEDMLIVKELAQEVKKQYLSARGTAP